uniref:Interferon regulatory factor 2 n=1 Tax=Molossus molossus TaxID=27622 RepID=A0A7J8GKW2_MOLMO|nr:interferon regulatory factor 2 [Molossus molossus]
MQPDTGGMWKKMHRSLETGQSIQESINQEWINLIQKHGRRIFGVP